MPRTATRRRALAAALACAAMLSACTGNSDDGTAGTGVSATPAVAPDAAADHRRLGRRCRGDVRRSTPRPAGAAAREQGLRRGGARSRPTPTPRRCPGRTAAEKADAELSTDGRQGARASRAAGDTPPQILAQTTLKKTGAAVLVLLVGGQAGAPFKAAAVTPDAPGRQARRPRPHDRRLGRRRRRRGPERQARRRRRGVRRVGEVPRADGDQGARRRPAVGAAAPVGPRPVAGPQQPGRLHPGARRPRASSAACASRTARAPSSSPTSCATTPSPCAPRVKLTPGQGPHAPDRHQADHDRGQPDLQRDRRHRHPCVADRRASSPLRTSSSPARVGEAGLIYESPAIHRSSTARCRRPVIAQASGPAGWPRLRRGPHLRGRCSASSSRALTPRSATSSRRPTGTPSSWCCGRRGSRSRPTSSRPSARSPVATPAASSS